MKILLNKALGRLGVQVLGSESVRVLERNSEALRQVQETLEAVQARIAALEHDLAQARAIQPALERQLADRATELKQAQETAELFRSRNETLLEQLAQVRTAYDELQRQLADQQRQTGAARTQQEQTRDAELLHFRTLSDFYFDAARKVNRKSSPATKPVMIVLVTTVSQMPQFRSFVEAAPIRSAYDLVIVGYLDVHDAGLFDYCSAHDMTLLDYKLERLCGKPLVEDARAEPSAYFGASLPLDGFSAEDQHLLKHTNQLLAEVHWHNSIAWAAHRVLMQSAASLLVLFEDNAEYHTGIWVRVAQHVAVPSVVIPYAIIDSGDAAEAHFGDAAFWADQGPYNRFAKSVLGRWVLSYRGRSLIRRQAVGLLASETLGYAPPQPWVWNSSRANLIAVESEAMRQVYLAQGIPDEQIEVTGSLADDTLAECLKNPKPIREQLGLDAERRVLICGFPPNQLSTGRPEIEFDDFGRIVDVWLGELAKLEGWQVVIKPHPAMQRADIDRLKTYRFPVTDMDTSRLIAVCDLFNTSVSSTIRWALACGKPVLNYDVYRYRYQDFVHEPAVVTVFDSAEFADQLHRMTGDRAVLESYAEKARTAASRWGLLDGRSTERIASLLDRVKT